jgi:membrane associated rhomboid family serine protease
MFVPIHDDTPLKVIRFQLVTIALIVLNVGAFLLTGAFGSEEALMAVAGGFGVVPAEFFGIVEPLIGYDPVSEPLTLITYQFLHAGWLHLVSNMLFLWVFGDNVEDAFGHLAFGLFYLVCGVAGALVHIAISPGSLSPLVGASGAVSGVLGAYWLLYPKARVLVIFNFFIPVRLSAMWILGAWFALQVVSVYWNSGSDVGVAFWAHIGGFLAGLALTWALRGRLLLRAAK